MLPLKLTQLKLMQLLQPTQLPIIFCDELKFPVVQCCNATHVAAMVDTTLPLPTLQPKWQTREQLVETLADGLARDGLPTLDDLQPYVAFYYFLSDLSFLDVAAEAIANGFCMFYCRYGGNDSNDDTVDDMVADTVAAFVATEDLAIVMKHKLEDSYYLALV